VEYTPHWYLKGLIEVHFFGPIPSQTSCKGVLIKTFIDRKTSTHSEIVSHKALPLLMTKTI